MIADDDCVMATFMRDDYLRIFTVYTVMEWVHKFWDLVTLEAFEHKAEDNEHDRVDFAAYQELHKRISKTIHEKGYFSAKREMQDATADWKEDLERAHHGSGGLPDISLDSLSKTEFCDAIFQLVDVWCDHVDAMDLFVEFLKTVFSSISYLDREQKCFRYKKMGQIKSLHDRLEDIRGVTLAQFKVDEAARQEKCVATSQCSLSLRAKLLVIAHTRWNRLLVRRKEIHAERGVQSKAGSRLHGKVLRSSVLIGMAGKHAGMLGSTSLHTDDTPVASGDMADVKDSATKLRGRTKALIAFDVTEGLLDDSPSTEQSASKGDGKRWLYSSKRDWKNIGIMNGGPVLVKVPVEITGKRRGLAMRDGDEVWVNGTVIRCASDRIVVTHGGGKTLTLYSNNPDTYARINGYKVEYAPAGSSKDWQQHSP
jgi:hypothetical protein